MNSVRGARNIKPWPVSMTYGLIRKGSCAQYFSYDRLHAHGLIHFFETGEGDVYRFSLLPRKQEKTKKKRKKKRRKKEKKKKRKERKKRKKKEKKGKKGKKNLL